MFLRNGKEPRNYREKVFAWWQAFPIVFAIDFFDIQTFRNILVTSRAAKFALGEILSFRQEL